MSQRDYYEVLGLERAADNREVKKAYRRLAMEYHPDRNSEPEAEGKFKEASEAYEVLSDPNKRRIYDTAGFAGLKNQGFSGFSGVGMEDIFSSFGDVFGDLFGFNRTRRGPGGMQRGADIRAELVLDFEEAVFGASKEVTLEQYVTCEPCDGSGSEPGSRPTRCSTCQGNGQVVHGQGMFLISTTCPDCRGRGQKHGSPCRDCDGQGRAAARRKLTIKVPAGFDDGMSLRYGGEGEPGVMGGPSGDLYVYTRVTPHETLRREGDELIAQVAVGMVEAALGTTVSVDGVEGEERIEIPAGTQPGDVITLKRKGVPRLRGGGRGGLHVLVSIEVPRKLSSRQKELLEEFVDEAGGKKSSKKSGGKSDKKSGKKRRLFS